MAVEEFGLRIAGPFDTTMETSDALDETELAVTRKDKSMIPQELQPYLPQIVTAIVGLFFGWLFTKLAASAKISAGNERLKAEERRAAEIEARLAQTAADADRNEQDAQTFRNQLTEIRSRLESEIKAAAEKEALLERAE